MYCLARSEGTIERQAPLKPNRYIAAFGVFFGMVLVFVGFVFFRYMSLPTDDYGYLRACFLRDAVTLGSCGIGAVLCALTGFLFLQKVYESRLRPILATVLFVPISIGIAFIPAPLMRLTADMLSCHTYLEMGGGEPVLFREGYLYSGDEGFVFIIVSMFSACLAIAANVVFIICLACLHFLRKRSRCAE